MSFKTFALRAIAAAATGLAMGSASAVPVIWTDWTAFSGTAASGTMGSIGVTVSSGVAMNGVTQIGGPCTNYWTGTAYTGGTVSNAPTACEQLGLNSANRVTVTFSQAVDTLYMALLSVGQNGLAVTYDFDQAFTIDSEGAGYWGNDATNGVIGAGDTLTMREFHGVLRFGAPVLSLTFSTAPNEYWHAFTFGAPAQVPEPGSLGLLAAALVAAGAASRRKRSA